MSRDEEITLPCILVKLAFTQTGESGRDHPAVHSPFFAACQQQGFRQEKITGEDRLLGSYLGVDRGFASALGGGVNNIVMHKRGQMNQFNNRPNPDGILGDRVLA